MAQRIKNVVLVHGAFADGSGWEAVAKILMNDGYAVSVVQHPETSYADDQKYTKAAIDAMNGSVVLVGHSYGGSIITEAGNHPRVGALVYIAAFALDEGESCASIEQALPQASKAFRWEPNSPPGSSRRAGGVSLVLRSGASTFRRMRSILRIGRRGSRAGRLGMSRKPQKTGPVALREVFTAPVINRLRVEGAEILAGRSWGEIV
jgi:pimeloyl-ACP methyl ester carboxylesterase